MHRVGVHKEIKSPMIFTPPHSESKTHEAIEVPTALVQGPTQAENLPGPGQRNAWPVHGWTMVFGLPEPCYNVSGVLLFHCHLFPHPDNELPTRKTTASRIPWI